MKKKILMLCMGCFLVSLTAKAQWVVSDPGNLAQGIINAAKNIVHTSSTATNMANSFQETVKNLPAGQGVLRRASQGQEPCPGCPQGSADHPDGGRYHGHLCHQLRAYAQRPVFTPEELSAIALGYTKLLEESAHLLNDLKTVVNENGLSMNDKERMDIIDRCYNDMLQNRSLVQYYTNKNIGVSYLRAKKRNDLDRVMALYGSPNERYW